MGWSLEDGTGTRSGAKVTPGHRLDVSSRTGSRGFYASRAGNYFTWTAATANIDADDTMLYLVNNSTSTILHIDFIYIWSDVATEVDIGFPTTYVTPAGGTVVTGVNCNRASGNQANSASTARADETANSLVDLLITLHTNELATDQFSQAMVTEGKVRLGFRDAIQADIKTDPGAFNCTFGGWFKAD